MIARDIDELIQALQEIKDETGNLPLNPYISLDIVKIKQSDDTYKAYLHFDKTFKNKECQKIL